MQTPKEVWSITPWARKEAQEAMNRRAEQERREVEAYNRDLQEVHGQAVRDYAAFERLLHGGLRFLSHLNHPVGPVAVDLGSGTGVGATILSKVPSIQKIYAVEVSENFVDYIMPLTFERFKAQTEKIVRVVGDFNQLELPDASIDLVISLDSLHHSEDLNITLKETYRVLKPQGVLIAVDRGWPDHYTDEQLEAMLDQELNDNLKNKYGIPLDQPFTRRDFGEHEYRYKDWESFFKTNGFILHLFRQKHPPTLNRLWSRLPSFETTLWFSTIQARLGIHRHILYGWGEKRILLIAFKRA